MARICIFRAGSNPFGYPRLSGLVDFAQETTLGDPEQTLRAVTACGPDTAALVESEKRRGDFGFVSKPTLRFLFPLIERNVRISRIALSGWLHVRPTACMIGASVRDG